MPGFRTFYLQVHNGRFLDAAQVSSPHLAAVAIRTSCRRSGIFGSKNKGVICGQPGARLVKP